MPVDPGLNHRIKKAFDGVREPDGVIRPDEGELLAILEDWDNPKAGPTGVVPIPLGQRLFNSWVASDAASRAASDGDRERYWEAAIAEATEAKVRIQAQVTGDKLKRVRHPVQMVGMAARAAELTAFAFAAADDIQHGYDMLVWAVQLEEYAATGDRPAKEYAGGLRWQERHQRGINERLQRFNEQQIRRMVALVHPHLVAPDGTPFYDPPLHEQVPNIATTASSSAAQIVVASYLLDRIGIAGPVLAQLPLQDLPAHLAVHDHRITHAEAVRSGERIVGYLGLHAAYEVFADSNAGIGAWGHALEVLEGAKAIGSAMRPGALDVVDKATGCKMLLAMVEVAEGVGTDEAHFLACRAGVLLKEQLFPTADATRQLVASPVVDQHFGYGATLRTELESQLTRFFDRTRADALDLGISTAVVDWLEAEIRSLSPDAQLELGAHAAVANCFGEASARPVQVEMGARRMGKPFPQAIEALGVMRFQEAERISTCLAAEGRALGLGDAAVETLRTIAQGRYQQAGQAFASGGLADAARDAHAKATGIAAVHL